MASSDGYDGNYNHLAMDGIRILPREEGPCIVCGHPTSDCTGGRTEHTKVVGANIFPSLKYEDVFIVTEDVLEERWISPFTKTTVIVVSAGTRIPMSKAKELGLI